MTETSLDELRKTAAACTACDLYRHATQTVFGEGPQQELRIRAWMLSTHPGPGTAEIMLVGEQPGDREDMEGHPFVGPAGRVLAEALEAAGIDQRAAYITNVVKHFKFTLRGKRRIHSKPNSVEIRACRQWLEDELALVDPRLVVCLGATAATALIGKDFRVTRQRGEVMPWPSPGDGNGAQRRIMATLHPSAILRVDDDDRGEAMAGLVADLRVAAQILREG